MKANVKRNVALLAIFAIFVLSAFSVLSLSAVSVRSASTYVSLTVSSQIVPSTIGPGDSGNLILTITNGGTEYARRVKLTVISHSSITFGSRSYDLGIIAPSGSTQISIPIAISSSIEVYTTTVFFSISYSEGDSASTATIDASTSISISRRSLVQIESVTWDKELIEPGDVVDVDIYVKNGGMGDLKDMTVELGNATLPFVSASGDIETYLGDLSVNELRKAAFSIIVNKGAETIAYRVPVTIKYYDESSVLHTDIKYIGLKISGQPDFIVTLEDDSAMYAGSSSGELVISLANRGTATASFLTLRFNSTFDIIPAEYYVGNLDPDDYETVTLSVDLTSVPAGKHSLPIEMAYKDPYNQEMSESVSIDFTAHRIQPAGIPLIAQLAIVGIVIIILYWKRKFFIGLFRKK